MDNKAELVVMALQQRIGELVSNYETQVAILRAEITQALQEKEAKQKEEEEKEKAKAEYSESLKEKVAK